MRKFLILAVLAAVVSVSAIATASLFPGSSAAQPGTLYAVDGTGGGGACPGTLSDSNLYTMNPSTGAATLVAPIMINSTPAKHVSGIAVHPSSGVLYGVMNDPQAGCPDFEATLLTINTSTGAATVIGSLGSLASGAGLDHAAFPDIDFDLFGQLYGWTDSPDVLVTIDITNGTATVVGGCGCNTFRTGLAIKATGAMYVKSGDDGAGALLHQIDDATGSILNTTTLDKDPHNLLAFDPSDVLFTGTRDRNAGTFTLQTINHTTGAVSDVGTTSVSGEISAIAFDRTGLNADTIEVCHYDGGKVTQNKVHEQDSWTIVDVGSEKALTKHLDKHEDPAGVKDAQISREDCDIRDGGLADLVADGPPGKQP